MKTLISENVDLLNKIESGELTFDDIIDVILMYNKNYPA